MRRLHYRIKVLIAITVISQQDIIWTKRVEGQKSQTAMLESIKDERKLDAISKVMLKA